jgi:hypothetical protein
MIARTTFAVTLAVCAIAAPAASAAPAPDLSKMSLASTDLPTGTSVLDQGPFPFSKGVPGYYRDFKLAPSSGFARMSSSVIVFKNAGDAELLVTAFRVSMRSPKAARGYGKLVAKLLDVRPRQVRVSKPRSLHVGDGGFTMNVRVNRKTPILVGLFWLDRVVGEIDARGTHSAGLLARTRGILRVAADRVRQSLSPVSLSAPTITGGAQVGAALQALPGTWSDATSFAYAWQRCDAAGTCVAVPGAAQQAYTVTAADAGSTLRVVVTAANAVGQTTAMSAPTAPVPAP